MRNNPHTSRTETTNRGIPHAKKSLGQCFLTEKQYARRIAAALQTSSGDTVLEIGPGRGILTQELLQTGAAVQAVEIDKRLIEPLKERFSDNPKIEIHHGDFLEADLDSLLDWNSVKIVGNLPYHLVAEVLFKILKHVRRARHEGKIPWIETAVLMMQKEVADRVVAAPGTKACGRLSVFAQLEARAELLFTVPAEAFRPKPKVDGGVVRLDFFRLPPVYPIELGLLERMVRFCFSQRRKMLKTSLSSLPGVHPHWQQADLDFRRRPETLSPSEWTELADAVYRDKFADDSK